jgi:hypothetical protein
MNFSGWCAMHSDCEVADAVAGTTANSAAVPTTAASLPAIFYLLRREKDEYV